MSELARSTLTGFVKATFPDYRFSPHLHKLAGALHAIEDGRIRRLIVTMPPRHGKSEMVSVRFPAWYLGRNPDKRIILTSYAADLAQRFSRQVRGIVQTDAFADIFPGVDLAPDSRSAEAWDIHERRGGMKAVGVGGPVTGHGANLFLIDDPIKNREEADSLVVRESVWAWYTSTAYTRLEDHGAIVLCMTRWHEDDLAARLLAASEADPNADQWTVLHMPAVSDDGRALWPEKYDLEDLRAIEANVGGRDWQALYQGRPTPRTGSFFHIDRLEIVEAAPANLPACRAWDMAATEGSGNFTAGVRIEGPDADGIWYVTDVQRGQWATDERNRRIRQTAELDGRSVRIHGPQDPGAAGKDAALAMSRLLAGFSFKIETVSGAKEMRADPFSAQVNAGNVKLVRGEWNKAFIEELRQFPLGGNDDQVDAASDAFTEVQQKRTGRAA